MLKIKMHKRIEPSDLKEPLSKYYIPSSGYRDIFFEFCIDLEELGLKITEYEDGCFYTNNLRDALDQQTDGLFSYLYGEREVVGNIHYSYSNADIYFMFEIYDSTGTRIAFEEDFELRTVDVEYLYDCLEKYSADSGIELPHKRHSLAERVRYDIRCAFFDFIQHEFDDSYSANTDTIRELYNQCESDMCSFVLERMRPDDMELVPQKLVAEAFWKTVLHHSSTINSIEVKSFSEK